MKIVKLTDLCHPKQWKTISSKSLLESGYPVYGANGKIGYWSDYNHEDETLTIACRGTCGTVNIAEPKSYINGNAMCLDNLSDDVRLKYLYYYLKWYDMSKITTGTSIPQITIEGLKKIVVPLPDLSKQDVLIEKLDLAMNQIETRQAELSKMDNLIKARFVEMFRGSKSYPVKPLSDIAKYWNGLTYKPTDVSHEGTIVLRSSNIQNMQLNLSDIVRVKCDIGNKKTVKENDILMCSRNGSAKLVGKVALIPNLHEQMSFGAFMMVIRSEYYPYLMTYFQLPEFRSQISTGTTTINQITQYMLDKICLPVPNKASIDRFSSFIAKVDKSKFAISQSHLLLIKAFSASFISHSEQISALLSSRDKAG